MTADPAATYERLRAETAEMFDYDLASASLTQGLQIDLVSLLRLEIDGMSGRVLAGETVDLTRLVAAHGLLRQMLPERALVAPAPPAETRFGPDHRARLRELINKTLLLADDVNEAERLADAMLREEAIQAQAAGVPVEAPVAPQPPEPPRADNVVPIDGTARANSTKPPSRYLKDGQPHEPWRDHVERSGDSMMAYRRDRWSPPYNW